MDGRIIKDYAYYLKIERAMSPNTVVSYCSDVESLARWTAAEDAVHDNVLVKMTRDDIVGYMQSRTDISKRSQARILSSFRSFFNWMIMEGYTEIGRAHV